MRFRSACAPQFWCSGARVNLMGVVLVALLAPAQARGQDDAHSPVQLEWVRLEGAEVCPPKRVFRGALEKRMGNAPFSDKANRVLTVKLSNENGPFRAVLSLRDKTSDEVESKQELFSYSSECDEVFAATVLSVALLLNPEEAGENPSDLETLEQQDSGFFDPPSGDVGLAVPQHESKRTSQADGDESYDIPVAPQPWARRYGYVGVSLLYALEQLPKPGAGFALRAEWPVARVWLLVLQADWLGAKALATPSPMSVGQSAGWLAGVWLPYQSNHLEIHLEGGLGIRTQYATKTGESPQVQLAARLGAGAVFQLLTDVALNAQAIAAIPFSAGQYQEWSQPALGGQLQVGLMFGVPGPNAD